jgi:hopanoid biosynthesis associated RND transporter like protein HpnN
MKSRVDAILEREIAGWVDGVRRRAGLIAWGGLALTAALGVYTALTLGINSDNMGLISDDLPSKLAYEEFTSRFPALDDSLLVVVDGETPELARNATERLRDALAPLTDQFTRVYIPGGGDFFERHALLYRELDDLDVFAAEMARMQPLIAELESDSSVQNLTRLVAEGLDHVREEGGDGDEWPMVLDRVGHATVAVYEEHPVGVSWEEVFLRGSSIEPPTRHTIVVDAILDPTNIFLAGSALETIRETAQELGFTEERGVRVRVTGNPALNYEEMIGILWDIVTAGAFCFALVSVVLIVALRSAKLVAAALITLLMGLIWTAAVATVTVGMLNVISISFAILFIGLGVDFSIHLGMRYADLLRGGAEHAQALRGAAGEVGSSLTLCAVSTAIGFYVFVPTDYRGVAELGMISGSGMFVILLLTLTYFPALLCSWLRVDRASLKSELRFRAAWWQPFERHAWAVRAAAVVAAVVAGGILTQARFDSNVVAMRDPDTESVSTFNELLADGRGTMWFVNGLRPDLEQAAAAADRLAELDGVDHTLTLLDYVPVDQEEKLEILADVAMLLDPTVSAGGRGVEPLPVDRQVEALRELHTFLDAPWIEGVHTPLADAMRNLRARLGTFLARIEREGDADAALAALEEVLLAGLPGQLARLRLALTAEPIGLETLPDDLVQRMRAEDGTARIQVFPTEDLSVEHALNRFVDSVRSVEPDAVGIPVNLVEFGAVTVSSFQQAIASALVAVVLLLWFLWRRASEVGLVMAPLLLSSGLTGATVVTLGYAFNFTNVIVLPLLLGIGVDSAIHLVHQAKSDSADQSELLESTTARAVFYSALTTIASFGSLAFSSHLGMHSLGVLLTAGMIFTVICNLVVLPALLDLRKPRV